jgi:hypothetical protein
MLTDGALPRNALGNPGDGSLQAGVSASFTPPRLRSASERSELGPEDFVFGVPHVETQHFLVAVASDPGGHHHGPRNDVMVDTGLDVGGVNEHIRKRQLIQRVGEEHRDPFIDLPLCQRGVRQLAAEND